MLVLRLAPKHMVKEIVGFWFFVFDFFNMSEIPGTEQGFSVIAVLVDEDETVIKTLGMCDPYLKIHQRG